MQTTNADVEKDQVIFVAPGASGGSADSGSGDSSAQAYDPETREINWDCPCLGGMANGPCGPQFRDAFSCFVHSESEPKGADCVDLFRTMQECFREHPEVYQAELQYDEDAAEDNDNMDAESHAPASDDQEKTSSSATS